MSTPHFNRAMGKKIKTEPLPEECFSDTDTFKVQVYSDHGDLLNEYELDAEKDDVPSFEVARERAVADVEDTCSGRVVIVVSGETLNKIRQIQIDVEIGPEKR